ncbi:Fe-S cluster assembly protein SufD [Sulfobacillus sp. hq2]|uniref:Fe-S cluster assembly protein SufD n=1 Tax=Sulfobacillus sp. hq2 TaxID=2039167 RepID=UPI001304C4C2|nr:Fe-S cluster assembly protein SufD [Sulfobacillus sp. hq2]
MTTSTDFEWLDNLEELRQSEPAWVVAMRKQALEAAKDLPWPERSKTPLRGRHADLSGLKDPLLPTAIPASVLATVQSDAYLAFGNGHLQEQALPPEALRQGIIVSALSRAIVEHQNRIQPVFGHVIGQPASRSDALNGALWDDGAFIYIPDNVTLKTPILILHYADSQARRLIPRSLIIMGVNSHATIIERYVSASSDERLLFLGAVEISAQDGASVHYGSLQNLSAHSDVFMRRQGHVYRDARIDWSIGEFGGDITIASDHTELLNPGAHSTHTMVFFGADKQRQDFDTRITHSSPHTTSHIIAKGVMKDKARSAFNGVTDIKPGAVQSDGRQKEQTLMLSDDARADAVPSLLINENDVFAAHSASTGPIDKVALFYLMARGLSEKEAIRLFVHGFLAPVVDAIPSDLLRNAVWDSVERKLDQ